MKKPEQAERSTTKRGYARRSAYHSHLKQTARRLMRRLGKVLQDEAPRRLPLRGWEW